jgi:elongation factor Ts
VEAVKAASYPTGGTVADAIANAIATVGENMTLRRAAAVSVGSGVVASYIHTATGEGLGRIGVLVGLESTGKADELAAFGRQVAMHIAATNPVALDASGVSADIVAREKAILMDKNAGKPANVMEKIVESGLKSYFKEVTLLDQAFVIDPSKTVGQAAKEMEGKAGAPVKIAAFVRYALGEGIEKKVDDFAAEVAAAVKG